MWKVLKRPTFSLTCIWFTPKLSQTVFRGLLGVQMFHGASLVERERAPERLLHAAVELLERDDVRVARRLVEDRGQVVDFPERALVGVHAHHNVRVAVVSVA